MLAGLTRTVGQSIDRYSITSKIQLPVAKYVTELQYALGVCHWPSVALECFFDRVRVAATARGVIRSDVGKYIQRIRGAVDYSHCDVGLGPTAASVMFLRFPLGYVNYDPRRYVSYDAPFRSSRTVPPDLMAPWGA